MLSFAALEELGSSSSRNRMESHIPGRVGLEAMYWARRVSKSLDLPITARLEAREWDLHVTDLMHGAPEGAMITPQCLSRSKASTTVNGDILAV